jgi:hypothetical protein
MFIYYNILLSAPKVNKIQALRSVKIRDQINTPKANAFLNCGNGRDGGSSKILARKRIFHGVG